MLLLDGNSLSIEDVERVSRREIVDIDISESARKKVLASRALVEEWVDRGEIIYGVTTGFGEFANVSISRENISALQQNLLRSHSAGVGTPLPTEVVRAMLLLRANALAKGYSGVREIVIGQLQRA